MLQTEFIRSLQSNYERILLQQKPDEKRYQYCILTRGGIRGLLPCSLRYINGRVYLYYDITSRQNVAQLAGKQKIDREWVRNFFWSYSQIRQELGRFLLDESNILVFPEQIFQDIGNRNFFFLYLPYSEEESGFTQLFDFLIDHLDYDDEYLVDCVYNMYERYDRDKEVYLQEKVFEDAAKLDGNAEQTAEPARQEEAAPGESFRQGETLRRGETTRQSETLRWGEATRQGETFRRGEAARQGETAAGGRDAEPVPSFRSLREDAASLRESQISEQETEVPELEKQESSKAEKKGILGFLGSKKRKNLEQRQTYYESIMETLEARAVAEETLYDAEEYGKTVYMEIPQEETVHRLCTPEGKVVARLTEERLTIGKQRGEVDLVLEDESVSRMHARIFQENEIWYLEDLNSTNGTFKNGLQMQPYEKRRLEEGDEVKIGKILFIYQ